MQKNRIKSTCKSPTRRFDTKTSRVLTTYSGTDTSGQVLQTNFEAHTTAGLPTRISDPEGRKTLLSYTNAGQLQTISNPITSALGKIWRLAYNSVGQLSQSTDRKGQISGVANNNQKQHHKTACTCVNLA